MFRVFSLVIIFIAILAATIWGIGHFAEKEFSGSLTEEFGYQRSVVWGVITNVKNFEINKKDVIKVEITSDNRGILEWTERLDNDGYRKYKMLERRSLKYLSVELLESDDGLSGVWSYELREVDKGTKVTITEKSNINNTWTRGLHSVYGRDINLIKAMKTIRVGLLELLLLTP